MTVWPHKKINIFWAAVCILLATALPSQAQQDQSSANEVYLTFQYRGVVSSYVTTYYQDGQFYLPVSELFNQLQINHNVDQGSLTISGTYLGETQYLFDFNNQIARAGDLEIDLRPNDFIVQEIDYFVKPTVLDTLFGLSFTTNFNNLTLDLKTKDKMPVIAQYEREQQRKRLNRDEPLYDQDYYPLQYDRNYNTIDGAFLDYNVSATYSDNSHLLSFSNSLGMELLGGDVQGTMFGAFSDQQQTFTTNGLRWRYVQRNNSLLSSAMVGQTNSEGIANRPITGVKISNKPVEPRRLFDRYPIEGNAPAQSEVELYLNNQLVDYQEVDNSENYRFLVPLTYGSTEYSVRIYTPQGRSIERNSRIQIPFDYLPPGETDYSISGGQLQNPILGSNERGYLGQASVTSGITNWLTARASTEYLTDYHNKIPSFTGTLNTRLFSNYLISANFNSENFYRLSSSVVYNNGASWNINYDYNPGDSRLYNIGGNKHQVNMNLFTPFKLGSVPLNVRLSSTYRQRETNRQLRYRADLSTRLGRLNIRFGYQDQQAGTLDLVTTGASRLTNSYTYSIGRFNDIPQMLRGMFLRGQVTYLPGLNQFEEMEIQLSRDLFQTGRIQFGFGHNFLGNFSSLNLNVTVDFNKLRSNTTARSTGSNLSVTQNIRGSVGYDPYGRQLLFNNRQQVGQSGAAVRLFVDNNNDGSYQDSTDDVITDPAVHLNRAGGRTNVKNGINYISQLLPYYRYDIEVNKGALSNPLLVPDVENFSIVTDPNQYKTIEIPFYLSGVISGRVDRKQDGELIPLSGVRMYLESNYDQSSKREPFSKEMRTFSDGSFYTYEIPPGKYNLFIERSQLEFLQAKSQPDTMQIEVESLAQGDFIEGLNFTVVPTEESDTTQQEIIASSDTVAAEKNKENDTLSDEELYYQIQLASFHTIDKAKQVAMDATQQLGGAFSVIKNSNNGMFAIRSASISERNQALETVISYHNSNYQSAALVILQNGKQQAHSVPSKYIQIGAYSTKGRATKFANQSAQKLNQETAITYHKEDELYKVYLNESFSSEHERQNKLAAIKKQYSYQDAYINEQNKIQIAALSDSSKAYNFAQKSESVLGLSTAVFYDQDELLFNIFIDENYSSEREKYATLSTIRTTSLFSDAFIANSSSNGQGSERRMNFTFNVQVKGVTEQSEQAFLSSISDATSERMSKRPEEDVITFNNVSTWQEAQQLQRKLSKISTVGHPVVILIEKNN